MIKALLDAYPDAAKAKIMRWRGRACCAPSLSLTCVLPCAVGCRSAGRATSRGGDKALLAAYPDAARQESVRCGRWRHVLCRVFSRSSRVCCRCRMGGCRSLGFRLTVEER